MNDQIPHTSGNVPVNVTVIARTPEEMAGLLYCLQRKIAALESLLVEHLRTSRRACLQEVGFLEAALEMKPTTKELRDKARDSQGLDKG